MRAVALLVAGVACCAVAALVWPDRLPFAWLAACWTLLSWPLGSVALLLIHAVTGGRWGEAVRRPALLGAAFMPVALLACLPLWAGAGALYPWLRPAVASGLANGWWLQSAFAGGRMLVYAAAWLILAGLAFLRPPPLAPLGLIVLALTGSFASIDLLMSLDPRFVSSVFPMLAGTGVVLFALSVALLLAVPLTQGRARDDLGKLLLALCLLWVYLDFVQYLVIWSGNLGSDAGWVRRREDGVWGWVYALTAALHGVVPLVVLAIPRVRRVDAAVMALAAALAVSGAVRSLWLVLPEAGRAPGWADGLVMAGVALAVAGLALLLRPAVWRRAAAHV